MNYGGRIVEDIQKLIALFAPRCEDRSTLAELALMVADHRLWTRGHDLFDRIRRKTLVAERNAHAGRAAQYLFEEICAKTLYNLSKSPAPFDPDSPYWILPNAFVFARQLGVRDSDVISVVAPNAVRD